MHLAGVLGGKVTANGPVQLDSEHGMLLAARGSFAKRGGLKPVNVPVMFPLASVVQSLETVTSTWPGMSRGSKPPPLFGGSPQYISNLETASPKYRLVGG